MNWSKQILAAYKVQKRIFSSTFHPVFFHFPLLYFLAFSYSILRSFFFFLSYISFFFSSWIFFNTCPFPSILSSYFYPLVSSLSWLPFPFIYLIYLILPFFFIFSPSFSFCSLCFSCTRLYYIFSSSSFTVFFYLLFLLLPFVFSSFFLTSTVFSLFILSLLPEFVCLYPPPLCPKKTRSPAPKLF